MTHFLGLCKGNILRKDSVSCPVKGSMKTAPDIKYPELFDAEDQPFTPPAVRPEVRCFSMPMNRITTGMMAKMDAAKRYCHSIML